MTNERCINIMKYLIAKYIDDQNYVLSIFEEMDKKKDCPPVKGIMYDFLKKKNKDLDEADKSLLDDLLYYYG